MITLENNEPTRHNCCLYSRYISAYIYISWTRNCFRQTGNDFGYYTIGNKVAGHLNNKAAIKPETYRAYMRKQALLEIKEII